MSAEAHSPGNGADGQIAPPRAQENNPSMYGGPNAERQMAMPKVQPELLGGNDHQALRIFMRTEINRIFDEKLTDEDGDEASEPAALGGLEMLEMLSQVSKSILSEYRETGLIPGLNLRLLAHQRR